MELHSKSLTKPFSQIFPNCFRYCNVIRNKIFITHTDINGIVFINYLSLTVPISPWHIFHKLLHEFDSSNIMFKSVYNDHADLTKMGEFP